MAADAVVLPGVGAFGDAMETLAKLDLVSVLRDIAASPKPLIGICLGMQLLMTESYEFGRHRGLGIIEGEVVRLEASADGPKVLKVPQIGWNRIYPVGLDHHRDGSGTDHATWKSPLLQGLPAGEYMYFVHSFYPKPANASVVMSNTRYGPTEFCSSLRFGSVFACQFHPERSGPAGLRVYRNLAQLITSPKPEHIDA
jgi:glutamine amidotransferase